MSQLFSFSGSYIVFVCPNTLTGSFKKSNRAMASTLKRVFVAAVHRSVGDVMVGDS